MKKAEPRLFRSGVVDVENTGGEGIRCGAVQCSGGVVRWWCDSGGAREHRVRGEQGQSEEERERGGSLVGWRCGWPLQC